MSFAPIFLSQRTIKLLILLSRSAADKLRTHESGCALCFLCGVHGCWRPF